MGKMALIYGDNDANYSLLYVCCCANCESVCSASYDQNHLMLFTCSLITIPDLNKMFANFQLLQPNNPCMVACV